MISRRSLLKGLLTLPIAAAAAKFLPKSEEIRKPDSDFEVMTERLDWEESNKIDSLTDVTPGETWLFSGSPVFPWAEYADDYWGREMKFDEVLPADAPPAITSTVYITGSRGPTHTIRIGADGSVKYE